MGFTSADQVDRLTLPEFEMLKEGALLREADREYYVYLSSYTAMQARAKKQVGKSKYDYVYKTFKKFYDRDERIEEITKGKKKEKEKGTDRLAAYKAYLRSKQKERRFGQ